MRNLVNTQGGVNNLAVLKNLRVEVFALIHMLDGSWFRVVIGRIATDPLLPAAFFLALVVLLVLAWRGRLPWHWRKVAFLILLAAIIWLQSAFTISGLGATHLYILYPIPQTVIVLALLAIIQQTSRKLGVVLFSVILLAEVVTLAGDYSALNQTGGVGRFSDAIYQLATDLDNSDSAPAAADWGFQTNVGILTQGRIWPAEVFGYGREVQENEFAAAVKPYLERVGSRFVFHSPEYAAFPGRDVALERLANDMHRRLVLEQTYYSRDNKPVIQLYRVEEAP